MSFFGFLSNAGSQNFALSRRELLGKSLAIGAVSLLPIHSQQSTLNSQQSTKPSYPLPEFKMGDLVAYDWEPDDDDAPEFATDFGEVLGMRWVPEPDGQCLAVNTWVYYIRWTHSSCPNLTPEPCYDGEPTYASDLRLVSAGEICKH
jgi:hypothetical protein